MAPQTFRASHHRSYDWFILKDNKMEIAVPKKAGIDSGISGKKLLNLKARKFVTKPTSNTTGRSYLILFNKYFSSIRLFKIIF
jgi:hypothetical protein